MIIKIEDHAKAYLEKTGTSRLLIDMSPDMTNSGCGCGKSKKYYTPYIRVLKNDENVSNLIHYNIDNIDIFFSSKAIEASDDTIKIWLEKVLFMKKLEVEGIRFIIEE